MNEFDWTHKIGEAHILPKDSYFIVMDGKTPDHLHDKFIDLYGWEYLIDVHVFDNGCIRNTVRDKEKYLLVIYPPNHTKDVYDRLELHPIEWDSHTLTYGKKESLYKKYLNGGFEEVTEEEFMKGIIV